MLVIYVSSLSIENYVLLEVSGSVDPRKDIRELSSFFIEFTQVNIALQGKHKLLVNEQWVLQKHLDEEFRNKHS